MSVAIHVVLEEAKQERSGCLASCLGNKVTCQCHFAKFNLARGWTKSSPTGVGRAFYLLLNSLPIMRDPDRIMIQHAISMAVPSPIMSTPQDGLKMKRTATMDRPMARGISSDSIFDSFL